MAISISSDSLQTSGSISFSQLRNKFKKTTSGSVKFSELYRTLVLDFSIIPIGLYRKENL
jgi:hypothetical protein